MSALDIRVHLKPQLAQEEWAVRVKSWLGGHQGCQHSILWYKWSPKLHRRSGPLGLEVGWWTLGVSALDIRVYLEPKTAQEEWTFRVKSWLGGTCGASALDIRVYLEPQIAQGECTFRVKSWLRDIRGVSTRH